MQVIRRGFIWPASDQQCHRVVFDELRTLEPALALCRAHRVAVQAGGNCGVWPASLAALFDRVVTFEPDAVNFGCLILNVPKNVTPHRAALAEKSGHVGKVCDAANIGAHYVDGAGAIPAVALDDMGLEACDFLCLDIEGSEPLALQGARGLIEAYRPVIQIEDKGLSARFGLPKGWAEIWLAQFGYSVRARLGRDVILAAEV